MFLCRFIVPPKTRLFRPQKSGKKFTIFVHLTCAKSSHLGCSLSLLVITSNLRADVTHDYEQVMFWDLVHNSLKLISLLLCLVCRGRALSYREFCKPGDKSCCQDSRTHWVSLQKCFECEKLATL